MGPVTIAYRRHAATHISVGPSVLRASGFTLIEVLVVLIVLALAAGVAVVAYDGDERGIATREAQRFAGALEHAAARAQLRAETLGVSAEGDTWRFWRRSATGDTWLPVADDDVLAPRRLPSILVIAPALYAGQPLPADAIVPLRASGRNEPMSFTLHAAQTRINLAADPLNRVSFSLTAIAPPR